MKSSHSELKTHLKVFLSRQTFSQTYVNCSCDHRLYMSTSNFVYSWYVLTHWIFVLQTDLCSRRAIHDNYKKHISNPSVCVRFKVLLHISLQKYTRFKVLLHKMLQKDTIYFALPSFLSFTLLQACTHTHTHTHTHTETHTHTHLLSTPCLLPPTPTLCTVFAFNKWVPGVKWLHKHALKNYACHYAWCDSRMIQRGHMGQNKS